jgi:hypothetical protein
MPTVEPQGERDTLAVVRLDRLGRSVGELLATVTMLKERGIALLSLEEKIDTSSAAGDAANQYDTKLAHYSTRFASQPMPDLGLRSIQLLLRYEGFDPGPVDGYA